jgi:hypothetical protein
VPVDTYWVRENLSDRVDLKSTKIGDLAFFFEAAPTTSDQAESFHPRPR